MFCTSAICPNNDRMFKIQNRKQGERDRLYYTRRSIPAYVDEYRTNRWLIKQVVFCGMWVAEHPDVVEMVRV